MTRQEKMLAKKRGRPATGRGVTIGVRMHEDQLAALDRFITQSKEQLTRPEAIRRIVADALASK